MNTTDSNFAVALKGETITEIIGAEEGSKEVTILTKSGRRFQLYHQQDCCEHVSIQLIGGSVEDILNQEVTEATEIITDYPSGESATKTIFGLKANYSTLVIEWLGQSNGYYSESVSFVEHKNE